jgi:hypothetical protein
MASQASSTYRGGLAAGLAQHLLEDLRVHPVFEGVDGERVAQGADGGTPNPESRRYSATIDSTERGPIPRWNCLERPIVLGVGWPHGPYHLQRTRPSAGGWYEMRGTRG